jgi:hypothetical protein
MNLEVLRPSRKRLVPGDVFVYRLHGRDYGYGRVIRTDCRFFGGGTVLIYIYAAFSPRKEHIPVLSRDKLLIPPVLINRLPWSRGYLETIECRPLGPDDVLPVHCFWSPAHVDEQYFNEDNGRLRQRTDPCGMHALSSFRTLDTRISVALGIPPSPDNV